MTTKDKTPIEQAAALEKKIRKLDQSHTDKMDELVATYNAAREKLFSGVGDDVLEILKTGGITP